MCEWSLQFVPTSNWVEMNCLLINRLIYDNLEIHEKYISIKCHFPNDFTVHFFFNYTQYTVLFNYFPLLLHPVNFNFNEFSTHFRFLSFYFLGFNFLHKKLNIIISRNITKIKTVRPYAVENYMLTMLQISQRITYELIPDYKSLYNNKLNDKTMFIKS